MRDRALRDPVLPFTPEALGAFRGITQIGFSHKALLYEACDRLLDGGSIRRAAETSAEPMTRIMLYLQEHVFEEGISLRDLASYMGYSYNYTSALFQRMFKTGFTDHINTIRLEEAARRLRNTDTSITQICTDCGFSTIRNFDHAFRGAYDVSPSAYRKAYRKG